MAQYRRGAEAIAAASNSGGGNFTPFVPEIRWKEDGEKKYVLVLTPMDSVGAFDLHEFIPLPAEKSNGEEYTRYETFMSRKDPYIGEDYDLIEDEHGRKSKVRCAGVAVELIPVMKDVKGRKRPVEFTVKTDTFTRKGDDGEEEVEFPLVGLIVQSSKLMWSPLNGYDESQGPLVELPLEVTRRGKKADTTYEFIPFMDIPVDLSAIGELIDGVSYLRDKLEDDNSEFAAELEGAEDDAAVAQLVSNALMTKRIEELADLTRYEDLVGDLEEIEPNQWEKGKKKAPGKRTVGRRGRPSQRKARQETTEESEAAEPEVEAEVAKETAEETTEAPAKSDRFAKLKARVEQK